MLARYRSNWCYWCWRSYLGEVIDMLHAQYVENEQKICWLETVTE